MEENKTFEEAIKELEDVVNLLEKGELSLDDSVKTFEKGMELSKYCNKILGEYEKKITILVEEEGELVEKNFTLEEG